MLKHSTKILASLVGILALVCAFFYMSNKSLNSEVALHKDKAQSLTEQVEELQHSIAIKDFLKDSLDEVLETTRENITTLEQVRESTFKQIDSIKEGRVNGEENIRDSALDPDLIRMLNEACDKVRGSKCPDPYP